MFFNIVGLLSLLKSCSVLIQKESSVVLPGMTETVVVKALYCQSLSLLSRNQGVNMWIF